MTVWIMVIEVYLHVILASIFLGMACGFQLWLFGTFSSIFLSFFVPELSKSQKMQIGGVSLTVVLTFILLTVLDNLGVLPTKYNVSLSLARIMYYINAVLSFGSIMFYMAIYNMRMAARRKELQEAADHDFLTGIFNRQRMQKILDAEIEREKELDESSLAVAIVDIDFFKKVNDTFGHDTGDEALKELAGIFHQNSYSGLLYGRWGGEEFLLISPENASYSEFSELLESIRKQTQAHEFISDGKKVKFTISIGAAVYERGMTSEKLVSTADDRLYNAKESGRNRVVCK